MNSIDNLNKITLLFVGNDIIDKSVTQAIIAHALFAVALSFQKHILQRGKFLEWVSDVAKSDSSVDESNFKRLYK